jgi:L-fucose/D-arabinose isomerase
MARIGLLSISDGREFVHREVREFIGAAEARIVAALRAAGHDVFPAAESVSSNEAAVRLAREVDRHDVDLTILHYAVWAFPHFTMLVAGGTRGPLLLLGSLDPVQPGMVGMLAAGGALDQIGRAHGRLWGEVDDALVAAIGVEAAAAAAVKALRGQTFGRIGGRPMGMNTAVANTDQWQQLFGIDVEEIDQWELVLRAEKVGPAAAAAGRKWFEKLAGGVHYDGVRLTPDLLERQVRSYLAMRELIQESNLDFSGIKGQPELTNNFATMDITEALLNDPYDFDGPKPTHVCATEADMDGALSMQILKHIGGGVPVLFADVRHYHADREIWDLCNSGQHATWYAARSDDPAENLRQVQLFPEVFFFPAGGASVHHIAAPGEMTFARLSRLDGEYRLQVARGRFERYDDATNQALAQQSTYEWPHAFTRLDVPAEAFLSRFGANHIHAIPGDHVGTLTAVAGLLGIRFDDLAGR